MERLLTMVDHLVKQTNVLNQVVGRMASLLPETQSKEVGACWVQNHWCTSCNDPACAACPECGWKDCGYTLVCGSYRQYVTYGKCC